MCSSTWIPVYVFDGMYSKRRFAEQQAEDWWNRNKERVFKKYNYPVQGATPTLPASAPPAEEEDAAPSSET